MGRSTPPPSFYASYRNSGEEEDDARPLLDRRSSSTAYFQHQNLMSPGADRVFAYQASRAGDEEGDPRRRADDDRNGLDPASMPSPSDILRKPMRFGAGVRQDPDSPLHHPPFPAPPSPPRLGGQAHPHRSSHPGRRESSIIGGSLHLAPGDMSSIALLLILYTLQGIPMGLSASVPFLLTVRREGGGREGRGRSPGIGRPRAREGKGGEPCPPGSLCRAFDRPPRPPSPARARRSSHPRVRSPHPAVFAATIHSPPPLHLPSSPLPRILTPQDHVSYTQQALFSLVSLPFSFKLLWAPIVDSTSFWGLGRRKAWLLPVQCLCGLMMLAASPLVEDWLGEAIPGQTARPPNVQVVEGRRALGRKEGL